RRSSADRSNWTLRFALHDRELGMGAHLGFDVGIPGGELAASSSQIPREVSLLEEETTLLQWTFSVRPVSAGRESPTDAPEPPRIGGVNFRSPLTDEHELEIRARAEPNEAGVIGTGPVR